MGLRLAVDEQAAFKGAGSESAYMHVIDYGLKQWTLEKQQSPVSAIFS